MTARQLHSLENAYLMALCCLDHYRLQGMTEDAARLSAAQFAATQALDWNELEELQDHLKRKDIAA